MNLKIYVKKEELKVKSVMKKEMSCPKDVIAGSLITKDKRHDLYGQVAGGSGSRAPEDFQRSKIEEGTGLLKCVKTNTRINLRKNTLNEIAHPNKNDNGILKILTEFKAPKIKKYILTLNV